MSTRSFLSRCGILVAIICPRYGLDEETMEHFIFFCPFSKEIWFQIDSELNLQS